MVKKNSLGTGKLLADHNPPGPWYAAPSARKQPAKRACTVEKGKRHKEGGKESKDNGGEKEPASVDAPASVDVPASVAEPASAATLESVESELDAFHKFMLMKKAHQLMMDQQKI